MTNIAHTQEIVFHKVFLDCPEGLPRGSATAGYNTGSRSCRGLCRASECFVGQLQAVCGGNCGGPVRGILPQAEVESVVPLTFAEMLPQQNFAGDQIFQLHARVDIRRRWAPVAVHRRCPVESGAARFPDADVACAICLAIRPEAINSRQNSLCRRDCIRNGAFECWRRLAFTRCPARSAGF